MFGFSGQGRCLESMALQSLQLFLRLNCFQFCQHLWRSENTRRHPIDWPLRGNEFALCGSMGEPRRMAYVQPAS
jgi:hypothetical protein